MYSLTTLFSNAPWRYTTSTDSLTLSLWVKPGARQNSLCGIVEGKLALQINAPAREGEANDEVIEFLAQVFTVKRRMLSIQSGHKSREKVVKFDVAELGEKKVEELPSLLETALVQRTSN
jgi:uncharacterized protein (TIGR00251 family)